MRLNQSNVTTSCFPLFITSFPRIWKKKKETNTTLSSVFEDRVFENESEHARRRVLYRSVIPYYHAESTVHRILYDLGTVLSQCSLDPFLRQVVVRPFVSTVYHTDLFPVQESREWRHTFVARIDRCSSSNSCPS
jgi:hypothetical protein